MKRTWIKVKRGLLEPKHRYALGECWQLYLYILDIADWDTGVIEEWKDEEIAIELGMPLPTLRDQRQKLDNKKYISCERKQHGIRVVINNWTNPREYSGEVYNKIPSDTLDDTEKFNSQAQNSLSSYSHTNTLPHNKDIYISERPERIIFHGGGIVYEPCDEEGNPIKEKKKKEPKEPTHPAIVAFRRVTGRYPPKTNYDWVISILGDSPDELKLHECKANWDRRGYNGNSLKWLEWYRDGVPAQGFKKPDTAHATPEERKAYSEWENQ